MADWFGKLMQRGRAEVSKHETDGTSLAARREQFDVILQRLRDRATDERDAREKRQRWYRQSLTSDTDVANTEEVAPSWAESFRIIWQVRTLRRIFVALPFVAVAIVGLSTLSGLYYDEQKLK